MLALLLFNYNFLKCGNDKTITYNNKPVHRASPVLNYVLRTFKGNTNTGYPQEIKLYLQ